MPSNLSNKEKYDLILAYISNELDQDTSVIIKDYIETNDDAKKQYNKLKATRSYFVDAYQPVKKIKMREDTEKMIKNYYFKRKIPYHQKIFIFLKKPIPSFALAPAFVAGFLGFVLFNPFALMNVATQTAVTNVNFDFDKNVINQMEKVLNQKTMNVGKKIENLQSILNKKYSSLNRDLTAMRDPTNKVNEIKLKNASVIVKEENNDCFSIEILSSQKSTIKFICKLKDDNWEFQD